MSSIKNIKGWLLPNWDNHLKTHLFNIPMVGNIKKNKETLHLAMLKEKILQ